MRNSSPRVRTTVAAPGAPLVHRPIFATRPSGLVVEAFERHVRATGSPETFDRVSTTRPPSTGQLAVLVEFRAERGKRPRGDYAPCPICNPAGPQYLHGLLIWCEATAAIYAIGMECGHTLDRDGRLDRALSAYALVEQQRALEDKLFALLPAVPEMRRWIATHMPAAVAADRLSHGFRKKVPRVYSVVKRAFSRNGELPVRESVDGQPAPEPIKLVGAKFIKTTFGAEDRLVRVDRELGFLDFGEDELGCIDAIGAMNSVEKVKALKWLRAVEPEVARVFAYLKDCAEFLASENVARLAAWSETPAAPFRLMAYAERGKVKVYVYADRSDWGDSLDGVAIPEPPPPL